MPSACRDPVSRGKVRIVLLNDEINAARDVTKNNTYRVEHSDPQLGILGLPDPDKIVFYRVPTQAHGAIAIRPGAGRDARGSAFGMGRRRAVRNQRRAGATVLSPIPCAGHDCKR